MMRFFFAYIGTAEKIVPPSVYAECPHNGRAKFLKTPIGIRKRNSRNEPVLLSFYPFCHIPQEFR
jgi:hypothetical protein